MPYPIQPLDASTWDVFAELVERNNGVSGSCWRHAYHLEPREEGTGIPHRKAQEDPVRTGRAHAALVIDEDDLAQGWCQHGSPEELPAIKHRPEYEKHAPPHPDWRITCIYVDKVRGDAGLPAGTRIRFHRTCQQPGSRTSGTRPSIPIMTRHKRASLDQVDPSRMRCTVQSRKQGMWWGTAIEAPDPGALARFYSGLLGWPIGHEEPGTAILAAPPGSIYIVFQQATSYQAPVWPPVDGEQRPMMHLDFQVGDLDSAVAEAVALGATVAAHQPQENVRVLLDPAGHPFCLCRDDG